MQRIFDKTGKGREEIATRKYRLPPRLRTLLLLIDGKQTTDQLLQKIAGLEEQSIEELLSGGFIFNVNEAAPTEQSNPAQTPAPELEEASATATLLLEGETKFQAIRRFYTDNIRKTLGLRGYNFQLKVDEAQSIDDLHALHDLYIAAVLKLKGETVARDLHLQLEQLFNLEEPPAET
jgi:hypothetical protein